MWLRGRRSRSLRPAACRAGERSPSFTDIEAKARPWAGPEPPHAELVGVVVDPLDRHAQRASKRRGVHERGRRGGWRGRLTLLEQLDDTERHGLDEILGKHHRDAPHSA